MIGAAEEERRPCRRPTGGPVEWLLLAGWFALSLLVGLGLGRLLRRCGAGLADAQGELGAAGVYQKGDEADAMVVAAGLDAADGER